MARPQPLSCCPKVTGVNPRNWHAKMLQLIGDRYSALLVGSSNYTCAGMGVGNRRNAEVNLLTIASHVAYGREIKHLETVWPCVAPVDDPDSAEWLGGRDEEVAEDADEPSYLPMGFQSALFRTGDHRKIAVYLDGNHLPSEWQIKALGQNAVEILSAHAWLDCGCPTVFEHDWSSTVPPEKLLVSWDDKEAFLPMNVDDASRLPPPTELSQMTSDDLLLILASADPSAAIRAWARQHQPIDHFDEDLDSAAPIDLDPLARYDLQTTFLHRIRRKAGVLAQLRANLERPVWSRQALDWRLRGLVGLEALANRHIEGLEANGTFDEDLLGLADLLISLREVTYQSAEGAMEKEEFELVYRRFLADLAHRIDKEVRELEKSTAADLNGFWDRVISLCQN